MRGRGGAVEWGDAWTVDSNRHLPPLAFMFVTQLGPSRNLFGYTQIHKEQCNVYQLKSTLWTRNAIRRAETRCGCTK